MHKNVLLAKYHDIEKERKALKEKWITLQKTGGDREEIKNIGRKLTGLTINQAHILIDLESAT